METNLNKCALCEREEVETTFHHLIPVCLHKKELV